MNILAIDTANEYLSIALATGDLVYQQQLKVGNRQSEHLLPEIQQLLRQAKLDLKDLNLIAYNQGPGSFTGLRIGLSCALGLAYSLNCRLLPIPTFALYAGKISQNYPNLVVALDARLNQVYLAAICLKDYSYAIPPQVVNPDQLATILAEQTKLTPQNCCLTGSGFNVYAEKFGEVFAAGFLLQQQDYPSALRMLELASQNSYPTVTVYEADLIYIRNKVALDLNEQRQNRNNPAC